MAVYATIDMHDILLEVALMDSLAHEFILPVLGMTVVSDKEAWIILPFVEGGNLLSLLHSGTPLNWDIRLHFALQAATAISYLHTRPLPIVHRDIKSLNFLVKDGTKLLLCDFGLAGVKQDLVHPLAGTPIYMAPELWRKDFKFYNEKADVYSFGMVLFEIATRHLPFTDLKNLPELKEKVLSGVRPEISFDCPKV
jgi:serine/threonine protein kinase